MTTQNRRDRYLDARRALALAVKRHDAQSDKEGLKDDDFKVDLDLAMARLLLTGIPPASEPQDSAARFSARYVPFLRPVLDPAPASPAYRGITVLPHPDGGVLLFATNARVMLIAHDRSGHVTEGGCCVVLSRATMDACNPPSPLELWFEGSREEVGTVPDYAMPGEVISCGMSMLVMPVGQPPDLDDPCNGGALYAAMIETDHWSGADRRMPAFLELKHIKASLTPDAPQAQPWAVTSVTQTAVAQAMAAVDPDQEVLVWDARVTDHQVTYIPRQRDDLLISFATARDPKKSPQIPAWVLRALEES
ncbi:hypothetical protein SXCC_04757 [Gluconacetobacter sp. SXCC-1]|uniref:hypothetical protein n=1 Tax=Komagataeibacter rhaeticus TaxID=215221 RepID=UPI000207F9FA|nr:hypothetical protein [Komagataeibacter rhaeticus]EGG74653.1 hypothetical protein SXCC_04757 [Gluconacetobacter sp. SXCC-1]WPP22405.1 hypothetical protein SCD25_02605 [Komagataeibacter rhaeticus]